VVRLSVNVNKVATLRNSRGGRSPSVLDAVRACLSAGARGITVHPRADQRHITPGDVREIAELLAAQGDAGLEYNIEGDPRPDWLALVHAIKPTQATLVPVLPGEVTSQAGWPPDTDEGELREQVQQLKALGIRVSLFIDPDPQAVRWASAMGADRIELFTGPFAEACARDPEAGRAAFAPHLRAAECAAGLALGVNAGHDLDLDNLPLYRTLPGLAEVSIGHAIISRAVFVGLETVVGEYLEVLRG